MSYTLTFNFNTNGSVTVNGETVESPYTMQDGDIIVISTSNGISIDGTNVTLNEVPITTYTFPLTISNTNIVYKELWQEPTLERNNFTINYTETGGGTMSTISAKTYLIKENPNVATAITEETIAGHSYKVIETNKYNGTYNITKMYISADMLIFNGDAAGAKYSNNKWQYYDGTATYNVTDDIPLRTIVIEEDQTVSEALANWWTANTEEVISIEVLGSGATVLATAGTKNVSDINIITAVAPLSTQERSVSADFASGNQVITPNTAKAMTKVTVTKPSTLIASNIKSGVNIAGITGTYAFKAQTKSVTPTTSAQTIKPDSSYDGLSQVTVGAIQTETKTVTPSKSSQTITPTSGKYISSVSVNAVTSSIDSNITAANIKKGVSILGVAGSLEYKTQYKEVTPSATVQTIEPDAEYSGLSYVTVNAVPTKNLVDSSAVTLDFSKQPALSYQNVYTDTGKWANWIQITKPTTLLAENIKKDINIAGVTGTLEVGEILPLYTGLFRFQSAPTISLSNSTLTITAVAKATSYDIYKDGTLLSNVTSLTTDLSTLITTAGTYTITVKAKAEGYADSAASNEVTYTGGGIR